MIHPKLQFLPIKNIKIGARFRDLLGDIESLTDSIKDKGVLQPITVDTNMNLLAGGRRLHAASAAGLTEIPALIRGIEGEIDAKIENTIVDAVSIWLPYLNIDTIVFDYDENDIDNHRIILDIKFSLISNRTLSDTVQINVNN